MQASLQRILPYVPIVSLGSNKNLTLFSDQSYRRSVISSAVQLSLKQERTSSFLLKLYHIVIKNARINILVFLYIAC